MTTPAFDVTHLYISHAPRGVLAGYTTGSSSICWTSSDWAAHPGAVHIDQDSRASDGTADVLDVEAGAATPQECADWAKRALAAFKAGKRPGQRMPAIYMSAFQVPAVVNALIAGGVTSGVGLWVANWNLTDAEAVAAVKAAAGPFPIIGIQYDNAGLYDKDEFATAWLNHVSGTPVPTPPPTPVPVVDYHLSVTPHQLLNISFAAVPKADHYVVTFAPTKGTAVTVRTGQPADAVVHVLGMIVPMGAGRLTVNAIVNSKAALVGVKSLTV